MTKPSYPPKIKLPKAHIELTRIDFIRPPTRTTGNKTSLAIYTAVGRNLSQWSMVETALTRLFSIIIGGHGAESWALESILSTRGRIDALQAAANYELERKGKIDLLENFETMLKVVRDAGARRNDIAHGLIVETGGFGHYLVPHSHDIRKIDKSKFNRTNNPVGWKYQYTSQDINAFAVKFSLLFAELCNFSLDVYSNLRQYRT